MQEFEWILAARDAAFDPGRYDPRECETRLREVSLEESHRRLLERSNGFYAFSTALHVYGCNEGMPFHDLAIRNEPRPWRVTYGKLTAGIAFFFAEDVFGNQYAYSRKGMLMFDVETGGKSLVAASLEEWLRYIEDNADYASGRPIAVKWAAKYGPIPYGHHLVPKKPFVIGGEYDVENLYLLPWEKSLSLRADIARQISELPKGTPVVLKAVE